jgi:outer membrane protein
MKVSSTIMLAALTAATIASNAYADDTGKWTWRAGAHVVQPRSDNHAVVNVDDASMMTFSGTYSWTPNWGIEVLAALPFTHDINLNGGGKVADTKHLPPTASLQYHFNPNGSVRPYIGAGLNYTVFFSEDTAGALSGSKLTLDPSFGPAAQLGLDVALGSTWFINADARWFDIDTDATLDGASLGTVEIDPYAYGISLGRRF